MGQKILENHTRKVNKVILIIFGAYGLFFMISSFVKKDFASIVSIPFLLTNVVIIWGVLSYKNNKSSKYIGICACFSILVGFYYSKGTPRTEKRNVDYTAYPYYGNDDLF